MIVHNVAQNTDEWRALRAGKVTASRLSDILKADGTLRDSQGVQTYINELVAETLLGEPLEQQSNPWMDRGHDQEAEAANWYAFQYDADVQECGFITTDDGRFGASCDRLVCDDGILEIKVPGIVEHISNMRSMTTKYHAQVMGQLYATGRDWAELLSYNCALPPVVRRFERDAKFIGNLHDALYGEGGFFQQFDAALELCRSLGPVPVKPPAVCHYCKSDDDVQTSDHLPTCGKCRKEIAEIFAEENK